MKATQKQIKEAKVLLKEAGYFSQWWQVDDIIGKAKEIGIKLSDDDVKSIVSDLEDLDCSIGINWDSIETIILNHAEQK